MAQHPTHKLMVSNLPATVTQKQVREVFGVQRVSVLPASTAHPTAAAQVTFDTAAEAVAAAERLNGSTTAFNTPDEPIRVKVHMANGPAPGESANSHATPEHASVVTPQVLWVSDLPVDVTEQQLRAVFGEYGTITDAWLFPKREGVDLRKAKVTFAAVAEGEAAMAALKHNEQAFPGHNLSVEAYCSTHNAH